MGSKVQRFSGSEVAGGRTPTRPLQAPISPKGRHCPSQRLDPSAKVGERPSLGSRSSTVNREPMNREPLAVRLAAASAPDMIQAAPGKWVPRENHLVPDYCLARWVKAGDGTYTLVPDEIRMVRLSATLGKILGFQGQLHTLYRLGRAGFIEIVFPAPHCALLNLDSWYNHLRRCAEDPEIWEQGSKYREEYKASL